MDKKRLLITGVSGLLANNLAKCWRDAWDIVGIYHTHPVQLEGVRVQRVDLLDKDSLEDLIKEFKPSVIVHCAALANLDLCETDHQRADALNVTATTQVCQLARTYNAKVVYISTDGVYEGLNTTHAEYEVVNPTNYYAITKHLGEIEALKNSDGLVVRTSFYGFNVIAKQCLSEWIISELTQGKSIKGFTDVLSSNIFTYDLAVILERMILKDLVGVYNVGCSDAISKYDFAMSIAEYFGFDARLIQAVSVDDYPFKVKRAKNLAMDVSKVEAAIGMRMMSSRQSLRNLYNTYKKDA